MVTGGRLTMAMSTPDSLRDRIAGRASRWPAAVAVAREAVPHFEALRVVEARLCGPRRWTARARRRPRPRLRPEGTVRRGAAQARPRCSRTHAALCGARVGPPPAAATFHSSARSRSRPRSCRTCGEHGARGTAARSSASNETVSLVASLIATMTAMTTLRLVRSSGTFLRTPLRAPSRAHARTRTCSHAHTHRATHAQVATLVGRTLLSPARGRRLSRGQCSVAVLEKLVVTSAKQGLLTTQPKPRLWSSGKASSFPFLGGPLLAHDFSARCRGVARAGACAGCGCAAPTAAEGFLDPVRQAPSPKVLVSPRNASGAAPRAPARRTRGRARAARPRAAGAGAAPARCRRARCDARARARARSRGRRARPPRLLRPARPVPARRPAAAAASVARREIGRPRPS